MTTASIEKVEHQLKEMCGKSFLVNATPHKVLNYRISNARLIIGTDKRIFEVDLEHSMRTIDMFLACSDDSDESNLPATIEVKSLQGASDIRAIIMDNIRKAQQDPSFIPQAQSVNESLKVLIDLAKTEIHMHEVLHKIKG